MTTTTPLLRLDHVTRRYPTGGGVTDIDLTVEPGHIHALVGLNGAGKSTLMKLALGMLRADSGAVHIQGHDVRTASPDLWASVGHLVDAPFAYPSSTPAPTWRSRRGSMACPAAAFPRC